MRVLNVENKDIPEFEAAVAKKTQMFNGKGAKEKFFTFKILTGPNAQNYARIRVVNNLGEFDYQNTKGNNFWFKTMRFRLMNQIIRVYPNTVASYKSRLVLIEIPFS